MFKIGSHCLFKYLKHKLWPKEGSGVKLAKSWESTRFTWLQTMCHIPLESSRWELQLCFRLHFDLRSARKVMGLQSCESPRWRNSGEKSHLDAGSVASHRVYYKGEDGGFPQVRAVVSLVCLCCPWLILAPRVLQLCANHLVWLCASLCEWVKLVNSS
jgi:hypothetical protein